MFFFVGLQWCCVARALQRTWSVPHSAGVVSWASSEWTSCVGTNLLIDPKLRPAKSRIPNSALWVDVQMINIDPHGFWVGQRCCDPLLNNFCGFATPVFSSCHGGIAQSTEPRAQGIDSLW